MATIMRYNIFPVRTPKYYCLLIIILSAGLFFSPVPAHAQKNADNTQKQDTVKVHSITRATVYSAVLPGLGQGYNKKYWKIPVIWAGFGVMTYFIVTNTREFKKYQEAYIYVANGDTTGIDNEYVDIYTEAELEDGMDRYRRYRDLSYIITGLWYVMNILDANVDAHLFEYDISSDISLKWEPQLQPAINRQQYTDYTPGVKITLKF
jgi:hypothetical protein